ncbi:MAG: DUF4167 domain-containing protein [Pseudomonadota bacterium]
MDNRNEKGRNGQARPKNRFRSSNNRRGGNGGGGSGQSQKQTRQVFDSNGPSTRVRGNPSQIYDKYITLAREAKSEGDWVLVENMLQHADHYFRVLNDGEEILAPRNRRGSRRRFAQGDEFGDGLEDSQQGQDSSAHDDTQADQQQGQTVVAAEGDSAMESTDLQAKEQN